MRPPVVRLRPFDDEHRDLLLEEEVANYADEQVRESGWLPDEALERARADLLPVLERELSQAAEHRERIWVGVDRGARLVGWVWVTPSGEEPGRAAFLQQITVIERYRRHGVRTGAAARARGIARRRGSPGAPPERHGLERARARDVRGERIRGGRTGSATPRPEKDPAVARLTATSRANAPLDALARVTYP